jgi:hypothetical protein
VDNVLGGGLVGRQVTKSEHSDQDGVGENQPGQRGAGEHERGDDRPGRGQADDAVADLPAAGLREDRAQARDDQDSHRDRECDPVGDANGPRHRRDREERGGDKKQGVENEP